MCICFALTIQCDEFFMHSAARRHAELCCYFLCLDTDTDRDHITQMPSPGSDTAAHVGRRLRSS
jgi:hypothetical protein